MNETLALSFFETRDVVGRRIAFGSPGPDTQWLTIVGVVGNARRSGPELDARAEIYFPHSQRPSGSMTLVVKAAADPLSLTPAIRQVVQRLDPEQPIARVTALGTMLDARLAERRFVLALLGGFAGVAVLLSAIGIYGVMAYTVAGGVTSSAFVPHLARAVPISHDWCCARVHSSLSSVCCLALAGQSRSHA